MVTTMDPVTSITEAEWEVMRIVWAQGTTTSKEVCQILHEKMGWKPATSKTLLGRLVEKKLLSYNKNGNRFIYSSLVNEQESVTPLTKDLLNKVCRKHVGQLIGKMVDEATLSYEDIDRLEKLLQEKRKFAVESITCNCVPGQCQCKKNLEGGTHGKENI